MKIGIYGGTFDPIHFGHLNLAMEILEAHGLDQVWFCPARINPHKLEDQPTPIEHRHKMVELAIAKFPQFGLLDIESQREGPSYTVDTLREVLEAEKSSVPLKEFALILGEDAVPGFFRWRQPEAIVKMVPILIGCRSNSILDLSKFQDKPLICQALEKGLTPTRKMDISGTELRERLRNGLICRHLVPSEVLDYIYAHQLYSNLIGR